MTSIASISDTAPSSHSLAITNLVAGYDTRPVAVLPSLHLTSGESCLIEGQSGSGKTSLLHAIAGLGTHLSGEVMIDGSHLLAGSQKTRDMLRGKMIGIVFQTLHLIPSLNVLDNILIAPYANRKSQDQDRAVFLLEQLGIAELRTSMPGEISHGQAQRVAIARAIYGRPAILLADEPTSGLDNLSCLRVIETIQNLARAEGSILIVASHDARISDQFSQNVRIEKAS